MKKYILIVAFALLVACSALFWWNRSLVNEKRRLASNQAALLTDVSYWKTEAGLSAASVEKLELTRDELKKYNEDLVRKVSDLNIKLKRVQEASSTATETKVDVKTIVRDSLVIRDSVIINVKDFSWRDTWTDIHGTMDQDSIDLSICSRDTLTQVIHRIPRKFMFFKCGAKGIRQTVASSNPHTHITYTEYIELMK